MSAPLGLIRILRKLPHTRAFDRHLTDCAAYEVAYRYNDPRMEPISVRHILKLDPLPPFFLPEDNIVHLSDYAARPLPTL